MLGRARVLLVRAFLKAPSLHDLAKRIYRLAGCFFDFATLSGNFIGPRA